MTSPYLTFKPQTVSQTPGETKTVNIYLDPGSSQIVGVDIFLKFNPSFIKILDLNTLGVFSSQTGKIIDNGSGTVRYALSNNYGIRQTQAANIATVTYQALTEGSASLEFVANPNSTADTNIVVDHGRDAINETGNLSLAISRATIEVTPIPSPIIPSNPVNRYNNSAVLGTATTESKDQIFKIPDQVLNGTQYLLFKIPTLLLAIACIFCGILLIQQSSIPKSTK